MKSRVFWLLSFLMAIIYISDTVILYRRDILKFTYSFAPKKYSPGNRHFKSVTLDNEVEFNESTDSAIKIHNDDFKYEPGSFSIDDSEALRELNLLCIPDSFGYSKTQGQIVFPNYTYPECWHKTGQNGTFIHIDREKNLLYMNCPDTSKANYIAGPVDSKKIAKGNEVFFKWEIKDYKSPVEADSIEFALGSCGENMNFMQGAMNPIFQEHAYKKAKELTKGKPKLIFFLTLDSMSRRHFFRKVPKVVELLNSLNKNSNFSVFDFKIHNILGADSISNQVPIFGGLDKFVREFKGNQEVDHLGEKAIWTMLRKKGFVSFLGLENCDNYFPGSLGRMPKVDYAVGPFYCAVQKYSAMKFEKSFEKTQRCLGGHHTHYYILNYTNAVIDLNPDVNLFLYIHLNAAHEATGQHAATLNDDLSIYLKEFFRKYEEKYDIFIYLNGDHGMRYGNWFTDVEAYQENKLPSLFIIASKSLLNLYPYSYYSLKSNTERLTSKLDLRETTLFLAGISEKTQYSVNLLDEVASVNRKCKNCSIEAWDCACNRMVLIDKPSDDMNAVLDRLVDIAEKTINVDSYSNPKYPIGKYCKFIKLTKILRTYHVSISNVQEFFKLEIESETQKGMVFMVNYYLTSTGNASKRNGFHCENIIFNGPVKVKILGISRIDKFAGPCELKARNLMIKPEFCACVDPY